MASGSTWRRSWPAIPPGSRCPNPPVLWDIESDPALAGTKLIAEAWDAAGLYQVGSFVGDAWKEWNGRFRDDVRDFFRGDPGSVRRRGRPPGRQPRDLRPQGARGRAERQLRHLPRRLHAQRPRLLQPASTTRPTARTTATAPTTTAAGTAASRGRPTTRRSSGSGIVRSRTSSPRRSCRSACPMILMGDEVRRTQGGNNNAYCQDDDRRPGSTGRSPRSTPTSTASSAS